MTAPEHIRQLVERFEQHRDAYRSGRYNETQLRREFLDPFFEALGWDVFNKQGYAELYKDVIHEDSLLIEGENKAPDYAFRIGGTRKFFVEAKKPAVNIEFNIHPAFQLRRYAWSAKLPLGILTDFEEFAVYDCRVKPDKGDKASTGRIKLLSYQEYIERWDEIASVFSREAVLEAPKIIYPDIAKFPRFYLDNTGIYIGNTAYCLGLSDYYLLGILNSKLAWFAISQISIPFGVRAGEFRYRLIYQYREKLPIRTINFSDPADKARHEKMVSLVERMLELHKRSPRTPQEQEMVKREIEATDRQIDSLVYELYGLTDEEIKIVEG